MAKRDPEKTRRNKEIAGLTKKIKELQPTVIEVTGYANDHSLNGTYGGKYAEYIVPERESIILTDFKV